MKSVIIRKFFIILMVFTVTGVWGGGIAERFSRSDDPESEGKTPPAVETADEAETVDKPEWVEIIDSGRFDGLYPGPDGTGIVGFGTGMTREEAQAAAAVNFAGNVSTEVEASVIQQEAETEESYTFLMQVQSEVRSQAIIAGLTPETWRHPRTRIWYVLYRTTSEQYRRQLEEWIQTMETLAEADRAREVQRLEDERAAVESRQEQIKIEEMREQVRLADRQMRADRHREFLYHNLFARDRKVPTGYLPEALETTLGFAGGEQYVVDGALDLAFWQVFSLGVDASATLPIDEAELGFTTTGRLMVQLLNRSGWVSSWTVGLGGFATASIGGADDVEWFDSGSWHAGPFGVLDILVPELMHTRYSLYAGLDYIQVRAGWYPFWSSLEDTLVLTATGNLQTPRSKDIEGADGTYIGLGANFRPIETIRIVLESQNLNYLRGAITFSY